MADFVITSNVLPLQTNLTSYCGKGASWDCRFQMYIVSIVTKKANPIHKKLATLLAAFYHLIVFADMHLPLNKSDKHASEMWQGETSFSFSHSHQVNKCFLRHQQDKKQCDNLWSLDFAKSAHTWCHCYNKSEPACIMLHAHISTTCYHSPQSYKMLKECIYYMRTIR